MTDTPPPEPPCDACGQRPSNWDSELCDPCTDDAIRLELLLRLARRRGPAMTAACPTPGKIRYATTIAARQAADRDTALFGERQWPYPCACGWWHLSTKPLQRQLGVDKDGTVYRRKIRKPKPTSTEEQQ